MESPSAASVSSLLQASGGYRTSVPRLDGGSNNRRGWAPAAYLGFSRPTSGDMVSREVEKGAEQPQAGRQPLCSMITIMARFDLGTDSWSRG